MKKYTRDDLLFNYWAYVFPRLNLADTDIAVKDYGLKILFTPCVDMKENTVLMGTWNNLLEYMTHYIGYEMVNDYMIYLGRDERYESEEN